MGFPCANRELDLIPRNTKDPNGYYARLGLAPDADDKAVARACRALLRKYHPDGTEPDLAEFLRVTTIYRTLKDPVSRLRYHRVPDGYVYVDPFNESTIDMNTVRTRRETASERPSHWDYYSQGRVDGDRELAGQWYDLLLEPLASIGFRRVFKVVLSNGRAGLNPVSGMVWVPRDLDPCPNTADTLCRVTVQ